MSPNRMKPWILYIFPHKASEDNLEKISTIHVQAKKAGLWR